MASPRAEEKTPLRYAIMNPLTEEAKQLELAGWPYPRHLAGRAFAVAVHADAEGADAMRHALVDWLSAMGLVQAGAMSEVARYIGYYEPYATSHHTLASSRA